MENVQVENQKPNTHYTEIYFKNLVKRCILVSAKTTTEPAKFNEAFVEAILDKSNFKEFVEFFREEVTKKIKEEELENMCKFLLSEKYEIFNTILMKLVNDNTANFYLLSKHITSKGE